MLMLLLLLLRRLLSRKSERAIGGQRPALPFLGSRRLPLALLSTHASPLCFYGSLQPGQEVEVAQNPRLP
jgi:hypothetical protein